MAPEEANEAVKAEVVEETTSTDSAAEQTNSPTADDNGRSDQYDDENIGDDWDDEESEPETDEPDAQDDASDDDEDESDESDDEDEQEQEAEEQADDETPEEPQTKAEKRKEQLNTEIRDLVSERNRIREEVERLNQEAYRVPSIDDVVEQVNPDTGDYYTRLEAEVAVMKQQQQLREYNEQISESRLQLRNDADRALREFPLFDESSPQYNKDLAERAEALLLPNLVFDPNTNQLIGSRVSPYDVYKTLHDAYNVASSKSQAKAQKATAKMLASADPSSGAHHKPAPTDAAVDAFDEEANRW